jgi:hypothetical protein
MYENKNPYDITQAEKIDLSFLLNLLDGVLEIPGRIVIMTSNYPKMLDHALIRPGRIDVIADFKRCSHQTMIEMIEFFYDILLTEEEKQIIIKTREERFSPAEMGKLMFENFGDYKNVLKTLSEEYIEKEVEEKKNDIVLVSTFPTDVFVKNTCIELENCATDIILLKDIPNDIPIPETDVHVGEFRPSNPKKTSDQILEEAISSAKEMLKNQLNIKKTYGVDAYGDNGLDSLDGILTGFSSKYEELK